MASYPNARPFGVRPNAPNVTGGISLSSPATVAPPTVFSGVPGATGTVTNGPGRAGSVPALAANGMTGSVSTNYNGGTPGNRNLGFGTTSNEPIPSSYIIVPGQEFDRDGAIAKYLHEGMLMLCAKAPAKGHCCLWGDESASRSHSVHSKAARVYGAKTHVMYDIYGVNQALKTDPNGDYAKIESAREVFSYWSPVGVFKNQAAPARQHNNLAASRMINMIVAVRVKAFNIWGTDIDVGTPLYLICKKVRVGNKRERGVDAPDLKWQLIPYADKFNRVPPASALGYVDEGGKSCMGSYIRVGISAQKAEPYTSTAYSGSKDKTLENVESDYAKRCQIAHQMFGPHAKIPQQIDIHVTI